MSYMFLKSNFNGDISGWNTPNVSDMSHMFQNSKFNGDIGKWNVSNVVSMSHMFQNSKFNQNIKKWDVSFVRCMNFMFDKSSFTHDISGWNISSKCSINNIFHESDLCDLKFHYDSVVETRKFKNIAKSRFRDLQKKTNKIEISGLEIYGNEVRLEMFNDENW